MSSCPGGAWVAYLLDLIRVVAFRLTLLTTELLAHIMRCSVAANKLWVNHFTYFYRY